MIFIFKENFKEIKVQKTVLIILSILTAMTIVAYILVPEKATQGKTPLVWTTDANPQREAQVDKFNELNPDCQLRIDPDNSGVMKNMVQCSSGMGPDIIGHVHFSTFQTYFEAGVLEDVTEEAKKNGFGLDTLHPKVKKLVVMKTVMPDGTYVDRQYVYPCNVYNSFIIYNKNVFDKYGVPYPPEDLTWDQYIKLAKKLTKYENEDSKVPTIFGAAGVQDTIIIWEKGADFLNKDGTRSTLDDPKFVDAMVFFHDLYYKYGVEPTKEQTAGTTSQGGWGSGHRNWFGQNKLAIYWGSRWMLISFRRFIDDQRKAREKWEKENPGKKYEGPKELRMGATLLPRFKGGKRYSSFGARCVGINSGSKNKEAAFKFMKYLAGKSYCDIINQGADSKPGNVKYYEMDEFINPTYPGEEQIHEMSMKSVEYSRIPPMSPFIAFSTMNRFYKLAKDKIITSKNLTREDIEKILKESSYKINLKIARNIKRDKHKRKLYEKLVKEGAEPIVLNLEDIR